MDIAIYFVVILLSFSAIWAWRQWGVYSKVHINRRALGYQNLGAHKREYKLRMIILRALREKCPNTEFFLVQIQENTSSGDFTINLKINLRI